MAGNVDGPALIDGIVMIRPMTDLPPLFRRHRAVGFDVPHSFDEEAIDIHHLQDAVGPVGILGQELVDVDDADWHDPRTLVAGLKGCL